MSGPRLCFLATIALLVLVAASSGAQAPPSDPPPTSDPDSEADAFFRAGSAAFAQREYRAAAQAYEEAHRRVPKAASIYNAGAAWDAANEPARALEAFEIALAGTDLDAELAGAARARVEKLKQKLGCIEVEAPDGSVISIAHVQRRPVPAKVCVMPGSHTLVFEARDGRSTRRELQVSAGSTKFLSFERPTPPRSTPKRRKVAPPKREPDAASGSQRVWGLVAIGGAGACAVAAIVLGLETLDTLDDYRASDYRDRGLHDRTIRLRTWTNVAWGGSIALGAIGGVLWWTAPSASGGDRPTGRQSRRDARDRIPWLGFRMGF